MPTGKTVQSGFTYLYVLMLIALIGMGLAAAGTLWRTDAQHARESDVACQAVRRQAIATQCRGLIVRGACRIAEKRFLNRPGFCGGSTS